MSGLNRRRTPCKNRGAWDQEVRKYEKLEAHPKDTGGNMVVGEETATEQHTAAAMLTLQQQMEAVSAQFAERKDRVASMLVQWITHVKPRGPSRVVKNWRVRIWSFLLRANVCEMWR